VARPHSFQITLSNNRTEKEGLEYLLAREPEWFLPDANGRRHLLDIFELDRKFSRAFDLVWIKGRKRRDHAERVVAKTDKVVFIELKTTKKQLANNPRGFFFGATKNEFDFADKLGERFRFCFVCLHPETTSHVLLSPGELSAIIKAKRIQYQINL
jgi:hypothetical protein